VNLGLEGKVALVCGASRGLGRAIAVELAAEGTAVAICSRDPERLAAAARELGPEVLAVPADLAVAGEPTRAVDAVVERFGKLDVLVTNTGGPPAATHDTLSLQDWDRATALLLRSTVELATAALPGMKQRRWGRILAVTSIAVKQPVDNLILSNSLRAAVTGYAKTLAREVAPHGITVNTILPGYTATERVTVLNRADAEREGIPPEEVRARLEASIPLGRLAEPEEFAALAAFLASERAGYITGGAYAVDGGWLRGLL
jgi:3-oxoacyl-[acyl-carrier protein] reductase